MSDNTQLNTGTGGDVISTDDLATLNGGASGTVKVQRVKVGYGADSDLNDVSSTQPLPTEMVKKASATLANVSGSSTNVTLLASSASRVGACFFNDSTSDMYLKFGATASTTSFTVKVLAGGYFALTPPIYTGIIDGIWDTTNGTMRVTSW